MALKDLLIYSGVIILLIILAVRFRRRLALLIIRMVYGHYSFEFLSTYKRYYIRAPFQYCFRDEFISHLLLILSKKADIPSYTSLKEIYFENTPYFIGYKEFWKTKGKPDCFNAFLFEELDFEIKAVGYQEIIAGSKATTLFYFMDDVFFMGEYIFKNPKTDIHSSFKEHFLTAGDIPGDNFYIEHSGNRIIHYHDNGFSIDIKYLSREDAQIMKNLQGYHEILTGKKLQVEA